MNIISKKSMPPAAVREQIMKLRTLPDCPNMFDVNAVQRLANDHNMFNLVIYIEENKKDYVNFILYGGTGEDMEGKHGDTGNDFEESAGNGKA